MSNVYANQPRYGRDVTSLMRRVNALEAGVTFTSYAFVEHGELPLAATPSGSGLTANVGTYASKIDVDGNYHIAQFYRSVGYFVAVFNPAFDTVIDTYPSTPISGTANDVKFYFDNAAAFCYMYNPSAGTIEKYDMEDGTLDSTVTLSSLPTGFSGGKFVVIPSSGAIHMLGSQTISSATVPGVHIFNSSGVYQSIYGQTQLASGGFCIATDGSYVCVGGFNSSLGQSAWAWNTSGSFEDVIYSNSANPWIDLQYDSTEDKYIMVRGGSANPTLYSFNPDFTEAFSFNYLSNPGSFTGILHANLYENGDIRAFFDPGVTSPQDGALTSLYQIPSGPVETEFYRYDINGSGTSLGTPNGGVSVPALDGIDFAAVHAFHIRDLRIAVMNLAPYYENGATTAAWNFDDGDTSNNLYRIAMGDRTDYGATDGAKFIWTRLTEDMHDTPTYDIDVGEIAECVTTLEASDPL